MSTSIALRADTFDEVGTSAELPESNVFAVPDFEGANAKKSFGERSADMNISLSNLRGNQVASIRAAAVQMIGAPSAQVIAEWHGQVTAIRDETFIAELKGTLGDGVRGSWEEAEIPTEEVRPDDLQLLAVGAFFRLTVNYELQPISRSRRRYTDITFRRLPAYRRDELEEASRRGQETARAIRME